MTMTATKIWRNLLVEIVKTGEPIEQNSAGAAWRGRTSYELLGHQTTWPMDRAVVLCPERKLGYRFLAAEAAWVISGSNRLEEIAPYAPKLRQLSDDGAHLTGAYGPPYVDQLPYVAAALTADRFSRQAVMTIWRPRPMASRDTPCTVALQWLVRSTREPERFQLHCVATMRSSDAFYGIPYDVHTFSMLSAHLALCLRPKLGSLDLGQLYLTAGSQHLYKLDREVAERCAAGDAELFDGVRPLDLDDFSAPDELPRHLWAIARREGVTYGPYLEETTR